MHGITNNMPVRVTSRRGEIVLRCHRDREDDGGRGVHPVAFRRSRREFIDERRARPRGDDPRVQGVRGAGVPREGG